MKLFKRKNKNIQGNNTVLSFNTKITLEQFMERFVAHNTVVQLFTDEIIKEDNGIKGHSYTKIWQGMDWQIGVYGDDKMYFEAHPEVEECPYSKNNVVKVIGCTDGFHTVDEIAIVIDKE